MNDTSDASLDYSHPWVEMMKQHLHGNIEVQYLHSIDGETSHQFYPSSEWDVESIGGLDREGRVVWKDCQNPSWSPNNFYRVKPLEPIEVPWDALDPKLMYVAADEDGFVFAFDVAPVADTDVTARRWTSCGVGRQLNGLFVFKRGTTPWDKSLIKRPVQSPAQSTTK